MRRKPETGLRARALQYLARREHSRVELRAKLLPYVQAEDEFEQTLTFDLDGLLDDLAAHGWLSDERAAAQFIHSKRERYGMQRITHELKQRGISDELIAAELGALKDSELQSARAVWLRKFGHPPLDAKEKAKQMRFMQSRGFAMAVIFKVLQTTDESGTDDL